MADLTCYRFCCGWADGKPLLLGDGFEEPAEIVVFTTNDASGAADGRRRLSVAILWLGRISEDTAGRTYLAEVLGPLSAHADLEIDVHLADSSFDVPNRCRLVHHVIPARLGAVGRVAGEQWVAARLVRHGYDVLVSPFHFLPWTWRGPSVIVLHNVLAFGEGLRTHLPLPHAVYRERALRSSVRRASTIIAISEYLRGLVLEEFPDLAPSRVHTIPYGVPARLINLTAFPAEERSHLLVVSALWDYKRVDQAIEAFAHSGASQRGIELLVVGPGTVDQVNRLRHLALRMSVYDSVRFLGNVEHQDLASLYRRAIALLYLSDIESFGLPVLEGLAVGIPVIAKRTPGVVEVAGDAPIWIDAEMASEEIGLAIRDLVEHPESASENVQAGQLRAREFNWQRTADSTAALIRRAAEPRRS